MEHHLLDPLLETLAEERRGEPDDLSAANIVAWRLLRGPYLGDTYASWQLAEIAPNEWRLEQEWLDGEWIRRDPLEPFYPGMYHDEEEEGQWFRPARRAELKGEVKHVDTETELSADLRARADALLERVHAKAPAHVDRLMSPTTAQLKARRDIQVELVDCDGLATLLRGLLGDACDWSLKAYGIEYHSHPNFMEKDHKFLVAHNEDEVCGILKIHVASPWTYAVGYVCTAPGFRGQGLSKRLYCEFIECCERENKVLVRTDPGKRTPVEATLAYDRMVRESGALHVSTSCPLMFLMETVHKAGVPFSRMREALKEACDDAIPHENFRRHGRGNDHLRQEELRNAWGPAFQALIDERKATPSGTTPKPRQPKP